MTAPDDYRRPVIPDVYRRPPAAPAYYPPVPFVDPPRYRSPGQAFVFALAFGPFGLYYLGTKVGNPWALWSVLACLLTCGVAAPVAWIAAMVAAPNLAQRHNLTYGLRPPGEGYAGR